MFRKITVYMYWFLLSLFSLFNVCHDMLHHVIFSLHPCPVTVCTLNLSLTSRYSNQLRVPYMYMFCLTARTCSRARLCGYSVADYQYFNMWRSVNTCTYASWSVYKRFHACIVLTDLSPAQSNAASQWCCYTLSHVFNCSSDTRRSWRQIKHHCEHCRVESNHSERHVAGTN